MFTNDTIIITDPCYIVPDSEQGDKDWSFFCEHEYFNIPELTHYIISDTGYGDWSCTTYDSDSNEILGEFCADSGMVGVFKLLEVLTYNPEFNNHIKYPHTVTIIENFTGDINIEDDPTTGAKTIIGEGNINFETHKNPISI